MRVCEEDVKELCATWSHKHGVGQPCRQGCYEGASRI